jgi:hypothetical protein
MLEFPETPIPALEEGLRIDHSDPHYSRETLLFGYLKLVGRRRCGHLLPIERDVGDVRSLLNCHFPEREFPLFRREPSTPDWYNDDLRALRWADILLGFHDSDDRWKALALSEIQICPWLLRFISENEMQASLVPEKSKDRVQRNGVRICDKLRCCVIDWPDFMDALNLLVHGTKTDKLAADAAKLPRFLSARSRAVKRETAEFCDGLAWQARKVLGEGNYFLALQLLSVVHRFYGEMMKPTHRWYLSAPFQIVSNRALAAERLGLWNLCRHDTRETLFLRHDHWRSYERLPLICEKFEAPELREERGRWVAEMKVQKPRSDGEWAKAAARAVGLISIAAIMESKKGTLTPEKRAELARIGIDDCFTPFRFGNDIMEPLPWRAGVDQDLT